MHKMSDEVNEVGPGISWGCPLPSPPRTHARLTPAPEPDVLPTVCRYQPHPRCSLADGQVTHKHHGLTSSHHHHHRARLLLCVQKRPDRDTKDKRRRDAICQYRLVSKTNKRMTANAKVREHTLALLRHCLTPPLPHSVLAAVVLVPCPPRPPLAAILARPPTTPPPTQPRSTKPNHRRARPARHPPPPASAWSPLWPACCARAPGRWPQRASRPRAPARRWRWRGFTIPP